MSIRKWSDEEVVLALYAYCHVPFNRAHNEHPWIVRIAAAVGRTRAAVKMKIGNLGVFDPTLRQRGIVGLSGASRLDKEVWNRYYGRWDKLIADAEQILARVENAGNGEEFSLPPGTEIEATTKQRVNQRFFREAVLSSYRNRCCITGLSEPSLLEACHIVSWRDSQPLRTNPTNGLCMTATWHQAYDRGLLIITPDYEIVFSRQLLRAAANSQIAQFMTERNHTRINLPDRFYPNPEFLSEHIAEIDSRPDAPAYGIAF